MLLIADCLREINDWGLANCVLLILWVFNFAGKNSFWSKCWKINFVNVTLQNFIPDGTANIFIILLIQFPRISSPPKNFLEKFYVRVISMSSKFVYCLIEFFFLLNFCGNAYFPPSGNIFLLVSFNKEFYIYWEIFFLLLYLSLFVSAK